MALLGAKAQTDQIDFSKVVLVGSPFVGRKTAMKNFMQKGYFSEFLNMDDEVKRRLEAFENIGNENGFVPESFNEEDQFLFDVFNKWCTTYGEEKVKNAFTRKNLEGKNVFEKHSLAVQSLIGDDAWRELEGEIAYHTMIQPREIPIFFGAKQVLFEKVKEQLSKNYIVLYLKANDDTLIKHAETEIEYKGKRVRCFESYSNFKLAYDKGGEAGMKALLRDINAERSPAYAALAHYTVEVSPEHTPDVVLENIVSKIKLIKSTKDRNENFCESFQAALVFSDQSNSRNAKEPSPSAEGSVVAVTGRIKAKKGV